MTSLWYSATIHLPSFGSPFALRPLAKVSNSPFDFQHLLTLNHGFCQTQCSSLSSVRSLCSSGFLEAQRLVILLAAQMPASPNTQSSFSTNEVLNLGFLRACHWGEAVANEVQISTAGEGLLFLGWAPGEGELL